VLHSAVEASPWRFQAHVEVWMVVAGVIALGGYVARVIAPKVPGGAITRSQKAWFALGVVLLWSAADWPLHDLAEEHLYWLHMVQHLVLTLVMPPVFWLATPRWLPALVIPEGSRAHTVVFKLARPVPAALIFNVLVVASHWTTLVNASVETAPVHYSVHLVLVAGSFLMWVPVCGPWPELRLGPAGACIYLFVQSIIPTVPGAWLTMAEYPVYAVYDRPFRLWGISAVIDQQYAGLVMKLAGGAYLWALIIFIFFRWALANERDDRRLNLVRLEDGIDQPPLHQDLGTKPVV
jgi:putative membrane protein